MQTRPVSLGLATAVMAYLVARALALALDPLLGETPPGALSDLVLEAIHVIPWLGGGFVAGYLSGGSPLKSGAAVGVLYGVVYCMAGLVLLAPQTHGLQARLSQLSFAGAAIIQYTFLFWMASALGHTFNTARETHR